MDALRLSATAGLAAILAIVATMSGAAVGCGPNGQTFWICLDPATGKENNAFADPNHYVNGVYDPCHCYDPGGPLKTCPDEPDGGSDAGHD